MSKKQKSKPTKFEVDLPGVFRNIEEATSMDRYSFLVEAAQHGVDDSRQESVSSPDGESNQETLLPARKKSEQETTPSSKMKSNEDEKSLWRDFIHFAEESRKAKEKDAQVWIDEDLKILLEKIRCAGVRFPIKHLLNGILKAFIAANQKDVEKLLRQKIKI